MFWVECILNAVSGTSIRSLAALPEEVAGAERPSRAEQIAQLRAQVAALGGEVVRPVVEKHGTLTVKGSLSQVLPNNGLPKQAVTHCSDTPALIVEIIDQVTAAGGHVGVVGWPELSYAAIPKEGLERIIVVPDPGIEDIAVAGVLAEGLDLVVLRTRTQLELTPVRARPLLARLRKGNAALLTVNTTVPSPALTITGHIEGFRGIGEGLGRINGIDLRVRAESKGTRPASTTVTLGQKQRKHPKKQPKKQPTHLRAVP